MDVKTKVEKIADTRVKVEAEVDAKTVSNALTKHYKSYANKYKFPGFRPGKAPRPVVDAAVGKETVYLDATEEVLNDAYNIIVENESLRPVGEPNFEGKDNEMLVEDKKPFKLEFELEVTPEIELTSYDPIEGYLPEEEATEEDMKTQLDMFKGMAQLKEDDELTDEIVKEKLGFDTLDALKNALKDNIKDEKALRLPRIKQDLVSLKLHERVTAEPTEEYVKFLNNVLLSEMYQNLQRQGRTLDQYLASRKLSADEFYDDVKAQAYDEAKTRMALDAWVKHFDLQATDAEIAAEFQRAGIADVAGIKKLWAETGRLWRLREAIERGKAVDNAVETGKFTVDEEKAKHQFDELNKKMKSAKKDDEEEKEEKPAKKTAAKKPAAKKATTKKTAAKKDDEKEDAKDE